MAPNRRICSGWETWLGWRLYSGTSPHSTSSHFYSWRSPRLKGTVSRDWIGPCGVEAVLGDLSSLNLVALLQLALTKT
jgi:hypothetical protein